MKIRSSYHKLAGIVNFIALSIRRRIVSHPENYDFSDQVAILINIFLPLIEFLSFAYFIYGFAKIAKEIKNKLLYYSSFLLIVYCFLFHLYATYNAYLNPDPNVNKTLLFRVVFVIYGICYLFFGYTIIALKKTFGRSAIVIGTTTTIMGFIYISEIFLLLSIIWYIITLISLIIFFPKIKNPID